MVCALFWTFLCVYHVSHYALKASELKNVCVFVRRAQHFLLRMNNSDYNRNISGECARTRLPILNRHHRAYTYTDRLSGHTQFISQLVAALLFCGTALLKSCDRNNFFSVLMLIFSFISGRTVALALTLIHIPSFVCGYEFAYDLWIIHANVFVLCCAVADLSCRSLAAHKH